MTKTQDAEAKLFEEYDKLCTFLTVNFQKEIRTDETAISMAMRLLTNYLSLIHGIEVHHK